MNKPVKIGQPLSLLAVMVAVAVAVCWVAGCAKKSGRETVPEICDTLSVIPDTLSKIHDTLSEARDTLSEIPTTLTDKRDGKTYKTVTIGKQTWMAENLNYATSRGSWCYGDKQNSCKKYGRLYDWSAAMNISSTYNGSKWGGSDVERQGVCPSGWHLPSRAEWDHLAEAVGGEKASKYHDWLNAGKVLKSETGWYENYGTNDYGFSALPGGCRYYYDSAGYGGADYYGDWWMATEIDGSNVYFRHMDYNKDYVGENYNVKSFGFSVRCVMDRGATGASSQKSVGDDKVKIEMVFVKGGTFRMGCTKEQGSDCDNDEKPAHRVTLSSYYIGKYEVTQGLWKAVMGSGNNLPCFTGNDNLPVECVSWNDFQTFIQTLNSKVNRTDGMNYRLPTEAEWEYAARGGQYSQGYKYSGSNSIDSVAWYGNNSLTGGTQPVGTKAPNELGIYDMSGNVWEWVSDWYRNYSSNAQTDPTGPKNGTSRVYRGGSWNYVARDCRVSFRYGYYPGVRYHELGFRLALSP